MPATAVIYVKAENIEITDEDTDEYLKKVGEDVNAKPEDLIKYFGMDFIKEECKKDKANSIMFDSAVVVEAKPEEAAEVETEEKPKAKRSTKAKKAEEQAE